MGRFMVPMRVRSNVEAPHEPSSHPFPLPNPCKRGEGEGLGRGRKGEGISCLPAYELSNMNTAMDKVAERSASNGKAARDEAWASGARERAGESERGGCAQVVVETAPRERRSVFGNYAAADAGESWVGEGEGQGPLDGGGARRPEAAEAALARSFVHQYLARGFDYPTREMWAWMGSPGVLGALAAAVAAVAGSEDGGVRRAHGVWVGTLGASGFEAFHDDYIRAVGHAARGSCPANEIEYGDVKADPLFQPHRLADLGAFYRAFGLEMGEGSGERQDHVSVELEFLGVLAAQEASWHRGAGGEEAGATVRAAERKFLREHAGRWMPAFARRLQRAVGETALGALALLAMAWIESECRRCGVSPGSEELLLRPADAGASMCDGCGLAQGLPGAPVAAGGGEA